MTKKEIKMVYVVLCSDDEGFMQVLAVFSDDKAATVYGDKILCTDDELDVWIERHLLI